MTFEELAVAVYEDMKIARSQNTTAMLPLIDFAIDTGDEELERVMRWCVENRKRPWWTSRNRSKIVYLWTADDTPIATPSMLERRVAKHLIKQESYHYYYDTLEGAFRDLYQAIKKAGEI